MKKEERYLWPELGLILYYVKMSAGESISFESPVQDLSISPFISLLIKGTLRAWNPNREPEFMTWASSDNLFGAGMLFPGKYELTALSAVEYVCCGPVPRLNNGAANMYNLIQKNLSNDEECTFDGEQVRGIVVMQGKLRNTSTGEEYVRGARIGITGTQTFKALEPTSLTVANKKPL